jgi:hypothetical protein
MVSSSFIDLVRRRLRASFALLAGFAKVGLEDTEWSSQEVAFLPI